MGMAAVSMAPVGFNSAAVVHLNGTRQPIHRATQAYRGECAFSPPVPPVHPQPFSLLAKGSSCPSTYSVLGGVNKGSGSAVTRSFTPGKALAKAALGSLQGVRNYLAENGAVNAQLDVGELLVLDREVGGSSFKGNPAQKQSSGNISIGDTMLHICVRHRNKALARWLLEHGSAVDIENSEGETALSLGCDYLLDIRSNFHVEDRLVELFNLIDENKDGFVNEPEAIKFALLTTSNDEANAFAFWKALPKADGNDLVSRDDWVNFFLIQFESQQVVMVLAQLQEILDEVSRVRGQAIGQTILSCRSTPLRTLHQQSWVLPTRQSFSPADRRTLMTSFRPRELGGVGNTPLYF